MPFWRWPGDPSLMTQSTTFLGSQDCPWWRLLSKWWELFKNSQSKRATRMRLQVGLSPEHPREAGHHSFQEPSTAQHAQPNLLLLLPLFQSSLTLSPMCTDNINLLMDSHLLSKTTSTRIWPLRLTARKWLNCSRYLTLLTILNNFPKFQNMLLFLATMNSWAWIGQTFIGTSSRVKNIFWSSQTQSIHWPLLSTKFYPPWEPSLEALPLARRRDLLSLTNSTQIRESFL